MGVGQVSRRASERAGSPCCAKRSDKVRSSPFVFRSGVMNRTRSQAPSRASNGGEPIGAKPLIYLDASAHGRCSMRRAASLSLCFWLSLPLLTAHAADYFADQSPEPEQSAATVDTCGPSKCLGDCCKCCDWFSDCD